MSVMSIRVSKLYKQMKWAVCLKNFPSLKSARSDLSSRRSESKIRRRLVFMVKILSAEKTYLIGAKSLKISEQQSVVIQRNTEADQGLPTLMKSMLLSEV
jgi:hypothetical protein